MVIIGKWKLTQFNLYNHPALQLDPDHMFAKAVQKIAEKNFKNKTKNGGSTFEYVMVENILNMIDKHMIMIATTKWLAKSLPRGLFTEVKYYILNLTS